MTISFAAVGVKSSGSVAATVSIAHPSGTAAGQVLLCGHVGWTETIGLSDEVDWTAMADLAGGDAGNIADDHKTRLKGHLRVLTGALAGPTSFDATGTINGHMGITITYSKTEATWDTATAVSGADTAHAANRSVLASSSLALQPGDMVVAFAASDTDIQLAGFSSPLITAPGITFGTTTRRNTPAAGSTSGLDGNIEIFDALVSSGTATAAPTLAWTSTTATCGPAVFIRLREVVGGGATGIPQLTMAPYRPT